MNRSQIQIGIIQIKWFDEILEFVQLSRIAGTVNRVEQLQFIARRKHVQCGSVFVENNETKRNKT